VAAIAIHFGSVVHTAVPVGIVEITLAVGAASYLLSDFWLRRE
jgi:hypothetical protein